MNIKKWFSNHVVLKILIVYFKISNMIYNLINHNKKIIAGLTPLNKKIIVEILDENYFPVKVSIPLYKMEGSKEEVYLFGDVLKTLKECEENKEKEGMK